MKVINLTLITLLITSTNHRRQQRIYRPLVPQLLPNYTTPSLPQASEVSCSYASLACNYRAGCGKALQLYQARCSDLVEGITTICSTGCRHSLIALISTQEGERLMQVQYKLNVKMVSVECYSIIRHS